MSKHIHGLQPGDELEIKGPIPKYNWEQGRVDNLGLIAGGTGITPMVWNTISWKWNIYTDVLAHSRSFNLSAKYSARVRRTRTPKSSWYSPIKLRTIFFSEMSWSLMRNRILSDSKLSTLWIDRLKSGMVTKVLSPRSWWQNTFLNREHQAHWSQCVDRTLCWPLLLERRPQIRAKARWEASWRSKYL